MTPPSAPTGLVARLAGPLSIELTWSASTDDVGVTGYGVLRNGDGSPVRVTGTSYVWNATLPRVQYCFYVTAYDEWNASPPSEMACVTTGGPPPHVDDPDLGITCSIVFDDIGVRHVSAAWRAGRLVDADMEPGAASGISTVGGYAKRIHVCHVAHSLYGDVIQYETFSPYASEPVTGLGMDMLLATRCTIATDGTEGPFVVYDSLTCNVIVGGACTQGLTFANRSGGTWYAHTVDTGDVRYPSVAVSSSGAMWVVYYDAVNGDLKKADLTGGPPMPAIIDATGDVGAYPALALDALGRLHVSYYDVTNGDLKYASGYGIQTVDAEGNVGTYTSLALDTAGKAHIAYFDETSGTLNYATNASGSWSSVKIGASATLGYATSIALDHDGKVYVLWIDYTYPETSVALRYATNATGTWVTERLRSLL